MNMLFAAMLGFCIQQTSREGKGKGGGGKHRWQPLHPQPPMMQTI